MVLYFGHLAILPLQGADGQLFPYLSASTSRAKHPSFLITHQKSVPFCGPEIGLALTRGETFQGVCLAFATARKLLTVATERIGARSLRFSFSLI